MASGDLTPIILTGSTSGKPISVAATATPGTAIHTPSSVSPDFEYVTLYAVNTDTVARVLTVEFGGVTAAEAINVTLAQNRGVALVCDRFPIRGAGQVIRAFADSANKVLIVGRVTEVEAPS